MYKHGIVCFNISGCEYRDPAPLVWFICWSYLADLVFTVSKPHLAPQPFSFLSLLPSHFVVLDIVKAHSDLRFRHSIWTVVYPSTFHYQRCTSTPSIHLLDLQSIHQYHHGSIHHPVSFGSFYASFRWRIGCSACYQHQGMQLPFALQIDIHLIDLSGIQVLLQ